METFKSNRKNKKIYENINYIKLLLVIIIPLMILSTFFYFIGGKQDLGYSIHEALVVSLLLGLTSIIGDLIDNRSRIFIINKDEIGYIDIHTERVGGPYLKEEEFWNSVDKHGIEEIYNNNYQYEGIDKTVIKSIISVKKKYNRMVVKANVVTKEWRSSSVCSITKLYVVEKEKKKKIIIPSDFDNYEKLYKSIIKKNKIWYY